MTGVTALFRDLDAFVAQGSGPEHAQTLRRVTDLFLLDAPSLAEPQVALFGTVILRLAAAIEAHARAELAERLADVDNAPGDVIRFLAHDEIAVARPVLSRSPRLSDDDLISVAKTRGQEHMLAISGRSDLTGVVTDILVARGSTKVTHAVTGNLGARFSPAGFDRLMEKARADAALQMLMSKRIDVPPHHLRTLITIATEMARQRLSAALPTSAMRMFQGAVDAALEAGADAAGTRVAAMAQAPAGPVYDYDAARGLIRALAERDELDEARVAAFAREEQFEPCVCAISALTRIGIPTAERLFVGEASDLLLIVAKALDWEWDTAQALLKLRGDTHPARAARARFEQLAPSAARRILHFMAVREAAAGAVDDAVRLRTLGALRS